MLTDHDIAQLMNAHSLQGGNNDSPWWLTFARAVERNAVKDAHSDATADAVRFRWLCRYPDWHFIEHLCRQTTASTSAEFLADLRRVIDARRSVELGSLEQHVPPNARANLPATRAQQE